MDSAFLLEQYKFELERRQQLTETLSIPIGVLSGLGSLLGLMASKHSWAGNFATYTFAPLLAITLLSFLVSLFSCLVASGAGGIC